MEFEKLLELIGDVSEEAKAEIKNSLEASYEKGKADQLEAQQRESLAEKIVSELEASGAFDTELAKSVMNMDNILTEDGKVSGLLEEIERLKTEYGFLFRQEGPQFSRGAAQKDEVDISSLNYLERLRLFKENPDLYKLQMNK